MSNTLCLYERGHFTEPEMCNLWQKISIQYNFFRFSVVIAPVGFNIDRVTTQHTLKCAENCSDNKVSYNYPSNSYQIFCKLGYNSENSIFSHCRQTVYSMRTDRDDSINNRKIL